MVVLRFLILWHIIGQPIFRKSTLRTTPPTQTGVKWRLAYVVLCPYHLWSAPLLTHILPKIWRQFRHQLNFDSLSSLMPIFDSYLFPPSTLDSIFSQWKDKCLVCLKQFFVDKVLTSFEILKSKFDLPQSHLFKYFQIRSFARHNFPYFTHLPPDSLTQTILSIPAVGVFISTM